MRDRAVAERAEHVERLLAAGELEEAARALHQAVESLGGHERFTWLRDRLDRLVAETRPIDRRRAAGSPAAGSPAVGSPAAGSPAAGSPAVGSPAAGDTSAELEALTARIRGLKDDGKTGEALELLQHTLRELGPLETLQDLRYELSQALLERDAEESTGGTRAAASLSPAPARRIAAHDTPLEARPQAPRPRDATATTPHPGIRRPTVRRSTTPPSGVRHRGGRRGGARSSRAMLIAGLLVVIVFAFLGVLLSDFLRQAAPREEIVVEEREEVPLGPGFVVLDAVPWAEITEIAPQDPAEPPRGGKEPAVPPSRFTPVILELPPGHYRIGLRHPPSGQARTIEIRLASDERSERRLTFEELDGERYFERVGW